MFKYVKYQTNLEDDFLVLSYPSLDGSFWITQWWFSHSLTVWLAFKADQGYTHRSSAANVNNISISMSELQDWPVTHVFVAHNYCAGFEHLRRSQ